MLVRRIFMKASIPYGISISISRFVRCSAQKRQGTPTLSGTSDIAILSKENNTAFELLAVAALTGEHNIRMDTVTDITTFLIVGATVKAIRFQHFIIERD